jgi:acetone carboxylase, beta subunit
VRMQYAGQLNDLEVEAGSGAVTIDDVTVDLDALVARFEELYARVFASGASSPELGYTITSVVLEASAPIEKPALPSEPESNHDPNPAGERPVWWIETGDYRPTPIFEQDELRAGAGIIGPAIIESPATTLAVPPGREVRLDSNRVFHMSND